jgi:hypothetical protein
LTDVIHRSSSDLDFPTPIPIKAIKAGGVLVSRLARYFNRRRLIIHSREGILSSARISASENPFSLLNSECPQMHLSTLIYTALSFLSAFAEMTDQVSIWNKSLDHNKEDAKSSFNLVLKRFEEKMDPAMGT